MSCGDLPGSSPCAAVLRLGVALLVESGLEPHTGGRVNTLKPGLGVGQIVTVKLFHVHEIAWLDDHRHVCGHLTLWISITKPGIIDND